MPYKMSLDRPNLDQNVLAACFAGSPRASREDGRDAQLVISGLLGRFAERNV